MWERLRRRQQHNGAGNPQAKVQSVQPPILSEPSTPAPPLAADNSPGVPTEDNATSEQPIDLTQPRAVAQELLANDDLLAQLPPSAQQALRGLLADDPTPELIEHGMAASHARAADLQAAHSDMLTKELPEILRAWYRTPDWPASRRWLIDHLSEMPPDGPKMLAAAAAAERARSAGVDEDEGEDDAEMLARHAELLREARAVGVDAAYLAIVGPYAYPKPELVDSAPAAVRQQELREAYEANVRVGKPPYAGVVIRTKGEVEWIVAAREWRKGDFETREQAIDLRDVGFEGAVLSGIDLSDADLSGAIIRRSSFERAVLSRAKLNDSKIHETDFSHADLSRANLSGVWMTDCSLHDAEFVLANLSGAIVMECTFTRTKLTFANLTGAGISGESGNFFREVNLAVANLSGAELLMGFKDYDSGSDLTQARMDSATVLRDDLDDSLGFQFDERTRLLDVGWNGAVLANVIWDHLPHLGDEAAIKEATSRKDRVDKLRDAARAYRGLAKALQAQGLTIHALKYRAREQQLERRALRSSLPRSLLALLGSWLLNILSGYGDNPGRAFACYLIVVGAFMDLYLAITNQVIGFITSHSAHLTWYEALALSVSCFHGRGFFPSTLALGDPVAIVAAAQAVMGLIIEATLVAVFTQRFFSR